MCAIVGALVRANLMAAERKEMQSTLSHIWQYSHERGRDGRGFVTVGEQGHIGRKSIERFYSQWPDVQPALMDMQGAQAYIGNLRAEPTTEYVEKKSLDDQQPYRCDNWHIVHNGTIANDKAIREMIEGNCVATAIDSAAIVELLAETESKYDELGPRDIFENTVAELKGSFAILAVHKDQPSTIYFACNYRPIWFAETRLGVYFASGNEYFPPDCVPQMIEPYHQGYFHYSLRNELVLEEVPLRTRDEPKKRALVVCSGGLDSVVAATIAKRELGYEIELINFQYGSRAEGPEIDAVKACAAALGVPVTLFPLPVYKPSDSKLLQADSAIAGGEAGAEFAHEWVPARNLLLLSVATAYAEANGFDTIVLGNNLEEAGAYPDNEPEFIKRFNDMLPYAVGDSRRMKVIMPVGNMMKHEIVKKGMSLDAPLDQTWSCYRAGALHCGTCGPCFMRRTAFKINHSPEVIQYAA